MIIIIYLTLLMVACHQSSPHLTSTLAPFTSQSVDCPEK